MAFSLQKISKIKRKDLETKTISLRTSLIFNQSAKSSQVSHTYSPKKASCVNFAKRMLRDTSFPHFAGSISIETALAFPIFLFFMINFVSMLNIFYAYSSMEAALHQAGRKMAVYAYAGKEALDLSGLEVGPAAGAVLSSVYAREQVRRYLGEEFFETSAIKGGIDGVSFWQSKIMEGGDIIDLIAVYQVQPAYAFMGFGEFRAVNRCKMHAWTGYGIGGEDEAQEEQEDEETVYITETGTVYHKDTNCTHLSLSVQAVSYSAVDGMGNQYGRGYRLCELCVPETNGTVYITDQGERFHTSISCSGLKRTITAIPISEAGGRRACSRCGS